MTGITDGVMIAESIIGAAEELGPLKVPVVVRLQGTNSAEGLKLVSCDKPRISTGYMYKAMDMLTPRHSSKRRIWASWSRRTLARRRERPSSWPGRTSRHDTAYIHVSHSVSIGGKYAHTKSFIQPSIVDSSIYSSDVKSTSPITVSSSPPLPPGAAPPPPPRPPAPGPSPRPRHPGA